MTVVVVETFFGRRRARETIFNLIGLTLTLFNVGRSIVRCWQNSCSSSAVMVRHLKSGRKMVSKEKNCAMSCSNEKKISLYLKSLGRLEEWPKNDVQKAQEVAKGQKSWATFDSDAVENFRK